MTTTEAALGQPVDVPASAPLEPSPAGWLPLTTGDTDTGTAPERTPVHEWPATLFIFLARLAAIALGVGAVGGTVGLVFTLATGRWDEAWLSALVAVGCTAGCAVQRSLANHVEHFSRWGWWGVMAELALGVVANAQVLITTHSGGLVSLVVNLLWMLYFWRCRADFGVEIDVGIDV